MIKFLSDNDHFEELVSKGLTIVDFYADWCGPCRMLGDILEDMKDYNILKVNVDEFRDIAVKHGVMSIPTLCIYQDGKLVLNTVGFKTKEELETILKEM